MDIAKKISPYSVKVIWGKEEVGSGLLVRSINDTYYLFTVRHLFKKGTDTNYKDVTESSIREELKNISIAKKSFKNDIFVDDFLFFDNTDLLIFSLKDKIILDLPKINLLEGNHQKETYFFYGYPKGSKDFEKNTTGTIEEGIYSQPSEEEKIFFRLSATKNIDGDAVSGYSGSGIFRKKDKNIYLVGLFSRAKEELSYYECVDLVAIIGDINQKLKEKFDDEIEVVKKDSNEKINIVEKISNDKKTIKEFKESSKKVLTYMMKKSLFIGIFIVIIFIALFYYTFSKETYQVVNIRNNDTLNLHKEPNINSKKIGELKYNEKNIYIEDKYKDGKKWLCKVSSDRLKVSGWTECKYLTLSNPSYNYAEKIILRNDNLTLEFGYAPIVTRGEEIYLYVKLTNNGKDAKYGIVTLGFPQLPQILYREVKKEKNIIIKQ